jgi:hypothetical protein
MASKRKYSEDDEDIIIRLTKIVIKPCNIQCRKICHTCHVQFESRNKLFVHLLDTPSHASLLCHANLHQERIHNSHQ